ncbi:hypothetical protein [Paraburkholderia acidipaludis]|uniref:hypothetical protein n=1 Tax=Paraburkholderia acidipaludis TaxID=660537 RepID=UPI000483411C|nr:hypothetical protein [Paraburkholderia acidipaludis]
MWYEASLDEQLSDVKALGEDWDGHGAASIDVAIVNNAKSLLMLLRNPPDYLLPSVSGTILIEWEGLLGRASLEIGIDTFGFYTAPKVGKSIFLGGSIRGLELGDIDFAVSTIVGSAVPHSLESIDWTLGIESLYKEGAAAA